jgi:hypothetical protein
VYYDTQRWDGLQGRRRHRHCPAAGIHVVPALPRRRLPPPRDPSLPNAPPPGKTAATLPRYRRIPWRAPQLPVADGEGILGRECLSEFERESWLFLQEGSCTHTKTNTETIYSRKSRTNWTVVHLIAIY